MKAVVVTVAGVGVEATVAPPQSIGAEVPAGQHLSSGQVTGATEPASQRKLHGNRGSNRRYVCAL